MRKDGHKKQSLLSAVLIAVSGLLGLAGCKAVQKPKTPDTQVPEIPQRDTIRPPYGEAVAMYGTPYRRYELKSAVPFEEPVQTE